MGRRVGDTVLDAFDDVLSQVQRGYRFSVPAGAAILLALLERLPDQVLGTRHDMGNDELAEVLAVSIERGFLNGAPLTAR